MSLGGNVCIRDGDKLDYPWREAVQSLLPICDVVVVCDGGSTDGTLEAIREWCERESKLRLCCYPWTDPKAEIDFWVKWLNFAREHVPCTHHIQLDADEILDEHSYHAVKRYRDWNQRHALTCHRLNYWRDHRHLVPHGVCLGHLVTRLAPTDVWMPSDGQHPLGHDCLSMAVKSDIKIHHYGFLRRPSAYFEKSKRLHGYFFGSYDDRLTKAEADTVHGGNWMDEIKNVEWTNQLIQYDGPHPVLAHRWLNERGYHV